MDTENAEKSYCLEYTRKEAVFETYAYDNCTIYFNTKAEMLKKASEVIDKYGKENITNMCLIEKIWLI